MCSIVAHISPLVLNARDPSRTTALRAAFVQEMFRRFRWLQRLITKAIVDQDVFGLETTTITMQQETGLGDRAFAFSRNSQKISAFMEWLDKMVKDGVLSVTQISQVGEGIERAWTNKYISDSYRRGVTRARYQMTTEGLEIPSLTDSGGIAAVMTTPIHLDRVGLLFTRTFNELKGITDAMDQQISRVLAQGLADGLHPRILAKNLNHVISGKGGSLAMRDTLGRFIPAERRATILARTEIIRAHAEGQLQEFKNWRVAGVGLNAEWLTAGDHRVCDQCQEAEDEGPYTIEEAEGMIPLHPQCRCIWLPLIDN